MSVAPSPIKEDIVAQPAGKPLRLRTNISWTFAGNLVYSGCQWGMLTVLAKLGSPSDVGLFGLGLAVSAPVMMFTNLQLRSIQATDARGEFRFSDYFSLRLVTTFLALALIASIAFAGGYHNEALFVILVAGVAKGFESLSDVIFGLLQQHEQMDRISISMMLKGPLSLTVLGLAFVATHRVLWGVVAMATVWLLILLLYDFPNANRMLPGWFRYRWNRNTMARLAWICLPMGFVSMLYSLNANVPRYFIERILGVHDLGLYAAVASLLVLGTTVISALGQSASPRLSRNYADGNIVSFRLLLSRLLLIGFVIGVAIIGLFAVLSRPIMSLLYTSEYAKDKTVILLMMTAGLALYLASVLTYALTAVRSFRVQLPINLFSCAVMVGLCWILIPLSGLRGAALSLLISSTVLCVFASIAVITCLVKRTSLPGIDQLGEASGA